MDKMNNWIFLRGLTRGKGHWGYFPEYFLTRFPNANIEFLDLPGNGDRSNEVSPLRIQDYVHDLRKHSKLIHSGSVNLLSISLGSMIAVAWQDLYPAEIAKTVLINTSFKGLAPWQRFHLSSMKSFLQVPFAKSAWDKENLISQVVCNHEENRLKSLPLLVKQTERSTFQIQNFFRQLYAAAKADFPVQPKTQIVLLASQKDRLVSALCTQKLSQKWGVLAHFHPTAGHDLPIDDPDWVLDHI
jgi:pimeloyl-ACP methyl ester carboxylesterase